jgi:hypothetical protein
LWDGSAARKVNAVVERKDVEAALEARRELGRDYEADIVDSLVEKLERRLDERHPGPPPAKERRPGSITPLALGSIGCGVGATAIATTHGAAWLAVVAWLAIVAINAAYAQAWRR